MRVIDPYYEIITKIDKKDILSKIESAGRICYKSEGMMSESSSIPFVKNIIKNGHESVLEHVIISVKFVCDRGISHEIVRHRIASFSQESTRYCRYVNEKFGGELTYIRPLFYSSGSKEQKIWENCLQVCEKSYISLIDLGSSPEEARSVLPNSLKTEILVTMNLREWRHFFRLRTSKNAHPQMRQLAVPLLIEMREKIPAIFDDIVLSDVVLNEQY